MGFEEIENLSDSDIKRWFGEIGNTKNITSKKKLKDAVILAYMPLAKQIAHKLARRSDDPVEDIIQVGSIGLIKAIEKYSPKLGASFKTYATYFITGEIRHYLRDKAKLVKAPRGIIELLTRMNSFIKELTEKNGVIPTEEEVAQKMHLTTAQMHEVRIVERRTKPISMSELAFNDGSSVSFEEKIPDKNHEQVFENFLNKIVLDEAVRTLDEQEREMIEMNFYDGMSQREISEKLGLSPMQVSRTLKRALKKLSDYMTKNGGQNGDFIEY